jgi:hypothetical protein
MIVDSKVREPRVTAVSNVRADEFCREPSVSADSRNEVNAILRQEEVSREEACPPTRCGDPSGKHRAVLITVAREQVIDELTVEWFR